MSKAETLEVVDYKQYGIQKSKAVDIQSLNTRLLYTLIRHKSISSTSTFWDFISNYYLLVHIIAYLSLQIFNVPK